MDYQKEINKHNLFIANHIYTEDILASMGLSAKKISPTGTLKDLCDVYNVSEDNQMLFLRKEAWGWRFRKMYGMEKHNNNGHSWASLKKMSYHIGFHDFNWNGSKYIKSRKQIPIMSCCFTGCSKTYKPFLEAFLELYEFILEFTSKYMDLQEEVAEQKAKAEAKLQAQHQAA